MSEYKSNHYVARMHLERFKDETGKLYYFNKNFPKKGIETRNTESIFCKNNLYTAYDKQGKRNVDLEKHIYGKLDDEANKLIEKIVTSARKDTLPNLTAEEKSRWDEYFFQQLKRTPDFHNKLPILTNSDFALEYAIGEYEKRVGPLPSDELSDLTGKTSRDRILQSAKVLALSKNGGAAVEALSKRGLAIARIENPKNSFIIGSLPIFRTSQRGDSKLDDPSTHAWFPIAHDVIVSPWGERGIETLAEVTDTEIRKINESIFKQSTEVAGRSEQIISSLRGTMLLYKS